VNGKIDRVYTIFSDIVYRKLNNIRIEGNSFHNIKIHVANPATKVHQKSSPDSTWRVTFDGVLPLQGYARSVTSVVATGNLKNGYKCNALHLAHYADIARCRQGPS
jgi:hypothetical protein